MGKLFGTDGIRGVVNQYPMTPELAVTIGKAVAAIFKGGHKQSKIVMGKDTRISGDMLGSWGCPLLYRFLYNLVD